MQTNSDLSAPSHVLDNQYNEQPSRYYKFFKSYDVRGEIPYVDEKMFYLIGKGLVEVALDDTTKSKPIFVMFDTRLKSEIFAQYIMKGIEDGGGVGVLLGIGSTDMLYSACCLNGCAGVQVTASHNPKNYHGLKIVQTPPLMLGMGTGLEKIREYVTLYEDREFPLSKKPHGVDQASRQETIEYFIEKIKEVGDTDLIEATLQSTNKKPVIVVDCANGAGGVVMPILQDIYPSIEFVPLYWELDGEFPHHSPDPQNKENLKDISKKIIELNADFGIAFDGDADRACIVDNKGEQVQGDYLVAEFAEVLLKSYYANDEIQSMYNPAIVTAEPNSRCVWDTIGMNGGVGIIAKQGHTHIKQKMLQYNALYGGENSNHHYFCQLNGMDSGALCVALFIKIFVQNQYLSIDEMFTNKKNYYHISPLINITLSGLQSFDTIKQKLIEKYSYGVISELDGLTVSFFDWRFSLRRSNTEPVIRLIVETIGKDDVESKLQQIMSVINEDSI